MSDFICRVFKGDILKAFIWEGSWGLKYVVESQMIEADLI